MGEAELMKYAGLPWADEARAAARECRAYPNGQLGRRLESELMSAFAANQNCAGITVVREPDVSTEGPESVKTLLKNWELTKQKTNWELFLRVHPGREDFEWSLVKSGALTDIPGAIVPGGVVKGKGTLPAASTDICTVVTGRGARIQ
jgi:hypothetical protein